MVVARGGKVCQLTGSVIVLSTTRLPMPFIVRPDGSIIAETLSEAIALSRAMASGRVPTLPIAPVPPPRSFAVNGPAGIVEIIPPAPPAPDAAAWAEFLAHVSTNPDTLTILRAIQAAEGGWVTKAGLLDELKITDALQLAGKLAGIVKTAGRLGLDVARVYVKQESSFRGVKEFAYQAGDWLRTATLPPAVAASVTATPSVVAAPAPRPQTRGTLRRKVPKGGAPV